MFKAWHVLVATVLTVFAPVQSAVITAFVLVIVDFVLGVWASRVGGTPFQSALIKRSVVKLFVYEMALICGFLCEQYLTGPAVPVSKIAAGFIGLTEFTSVVENLNTISGVNLLKQLIIRLGAPKE